MLFTHFTVDQSKLTVNGSVLSDTPNVRYLVALYILISPLNDLKEPSSANVASSAKSVLLNYLSYIGIPLKCLFSLTAAANC